MLSATHTKASDLLSAWGYRRSREMLVQKKSGRRTLIMERAYLGDRFSWTSLGYDGLNGTADFCNKDVPDDRAQMWSLDDWRQGGDYALVIGQVHGDKSLDGININGWVSRTLKAAVSKYKRVVYRPHPLQRVRQNPSIPSGVEIDRSETIDDALSGAICCITYSSNSGVNAVAAGVPVVSEGKCSMVADISSRSVLDPLIMPDRSDWLRRIAYAQWTPEELRSGEAWRHLRPHAMITK